MNSALAAVIGLVLAIVLIIRKVSPFYSLMLGALIESNSRACHRELKMIIFVPWNTFQDKDTMRLRQSWIT